MGKSKLLKIVLSLLLIFPLFFFTSSFTNKSNAASSKVKITDTLYKGKSFLIYPQVSGLKNNTAQKKINAVLTSHVKHSYQSYLQLKENEKEIKNEDFCKENPSSCNYTFNTRYEVKYNAGGVLSILLYDDSYTGGAHGMSVVTSYNFNISSGYKITLNDVLKSKKSYQKVKKYVSDYMLKHPDLFFDPTTNDFTINKDTSFNYTKEGIGLVFQEYEIAPYAAGTPSINIPIYIYK